MGLIDSGAAMGLVGSATLKRISARVAQFGLAVEPLPGRPRMAAGIGGEATVLGARKVPIAASPTLVGFLEVLELSSPSVPLLLPGPFLERLGCVLDYGRGTITLNCESVLFSRKGSHIYLPVLDSYGLKRLAAESPPARSSAAGTQLAAGSRPTDYDDGTFACGTSEKADRAAGEQQWAEARGIHDVRTAGRSAIVETCAASHAVDHGQCQSNHGLRRIRDPRGRDDQERQERRCDADGDQIITRTPLSISKGRIPWATTPEACTHEMMATRANATIAWFTCLQRGTRFPRTATEALDRKSLPKMT